jgi:hypothetical protein
MDSPQCSAHPGWPVIFASRAHDVGYELALRAMADKPVVRSSRMVTGRRSAGGPTNGCAGRCLRSWSPRRTTRTTPTQSRSGSVDGRWGICLARTPRRTAPGCLPCRRANKSPSRCRVLWSAAVRAATDEACWVFGYRTTPPISLRRSTRDAGQVLLHDRKTWCATIHFEAV